MRREQEGPLQEDDLMGTGIYLIQEGGQLLEMIEQPYGREELLQELLVQHPSLLAGGQINSEEPRRWLLVTREASLADDHDVGARWSVDHLFLDQDAIPTLVEVKRSSDTRIRREVVGQMLDYAANAVMYWPIEFLRTCFEATCKEGGTDPEAVLADFIGDGDPEAFWQRAKTHLQAGRIRLLFVADTVPRELQRIVEFLNAQMDPAEVLAVEIKQFMGGGQRTLVPRVIGQTAGARSVKSSGSRPGRQWDETAFFEELARRRSVAEVRAVREVLAWAQRKMTRVWWGQGATLGSFVPTLSHKDRDHQLFAVYTSGGIEIYFQWLKNKPAFASDEKRLELARRLNEVVGTSFDASVIARRPSIPTETLTKPESLAAFLEVYDWVVEEIRAT
jgi:hypothetical protein